MDNIIQRLRERPLYQRHLIVWIGSLIIFLGISFLWVNQIKNRLASFNPAGLAIAYEKAPEEESVSYVVRIQKLFEAAKEGGASLFSLFGQKEQKADIPAPIREGDELNKFLNDKGFEPFPK